MSSKQQPAMMETTGRINVRAVYRELWSLRKSIPIWCCAFYVSIFTSTIAVALATVLAIFIVQVIGRSFPQENSMLGIIAAATVIAFNYIPRLVVVLPVTAWGIARLGVNLVDRNGKFSDLLDLLRLSDSGRVAWRAWISAKVGKFLLLQLAFTLLYELGGIIHLAGILMENFVVFLCGFYFHMIWILFMSVRFPFVYFFVVDQGCEGTRAFKRSWRTTKGQWVRIGALSFFFPFLVSTAIASLFGAAAEWLGRNGLLYGIVLYYAILLVSAPIAYLTIGIAYRQVVPKWQAPINPW